MLDFAGPREAALGDKVLRFDGGVVTQTEFPERDFEMGALGRMRVEVHRKEQEVAPIRRALAVIEDIVVPGVVEGNVVKYLERR